MKVNLRPVAKDEKSLLSYIDANFRRLADALELLANIEQGVNIVNGSLEIDTGLPEVFNVIVSLNGQPVAEAAFVRAYLVGPISPRNVIIEVFDSAFNLSNVDINVAWIAIGK